MDQFKFLEGVDKILAEEDDNDDGYLSYAEYASNRRTTLKLQQAAMGV